MIVPGLQALLGRVSVRFALVLAVALLPLGAIALYQTQALKAEVRKRDEAALMGEVLRVASRQIDLVRKARGMALALAKAVPLVADDPAACQRLMRASQAEIPAASAVAFVPPSGLLSCSHTGRRSDLSANPQFRRNREAREPFFMVNRAAPVSGTSVLASIVPVFDGEDRYLGYVAISLPHDRLRGLSDREERADEDETPPPVSYWLFDDTGEVLVSTLDLVVAAQDLPRDRPLTSFVSRRERVFRDVSAAGEEHIYSVVPLMEGELYLMGSWTDDPGEFLGRSGAQPYLPPIIMWAVGLIVAAWAAEVMVTRHLRDLRRSILRFARGDRRLQHLDLRRAPVEFREIGEAYLGMTEAIMMGEAQLEDSLHQKEVLLREVHHRVKNNLQLIASIMNIQMRKAVTPEARSLLKGLRDRVMSLATIHRGLYQTSGLVDVRGDELLGDIVRQIMAMSATPGRRFELALDLDDIRLTPDQAVPLSLLLTEAMTNAIKYAGVDAQTGKTAITVSLKREGDGSARLEMANSIAEGTAAGEGDSTGLGAQLLQAFAQQLNGDLRQQTESGIYRLALTFALRPLTGAPEETAAD